MRVFEGRRFHVEQVEMRKTGQTHLAQVVRHPGSVAILPLLPNNRIVLIENHRIAVQKRLLELPAGTLEPGEDAQETAARELMEETGYQAASIELFFEFYTTPGFCDEKMWVFVAKELTFFGQNLDESEEISVLEMSWNEVMDRLKAGEIVDGKSIAILLYYYSFCRN